MIKMCFSCGTSITREHLLLGSHLLRSLAYNTTLPMITITSFLFNNVQQPNDYIYINQHHSTKRHFIYIYMQSLPLSIWWRTTRRTNQQLYCTKPQPIYDDTPKHNVISFISLSLAYSYPFILFHSFYQFHLPLTKSPSNIYSYALSFLLLDQRGLQTYHTTFTWYDDCTL